MVQDLLMTNRLLLAAAELQWRFSKASGPRGQGVNTTDSGVELLFEVEQSLVLGEFRRQRLQQQLGTPLVDGCLPVVVAEQRSQWQKWQLAMRRLAQWLRVGLKPSHYQQRLDLVCLLLQTKQPRNTQVN